MKKSILVISFFLLSFVIFGCSSSTTKGNNAKTKDTSDVTSSEIITMNKETMPDYSNNTKELVITVWSGIQPSCAILKNDEIVTGYRAWTDEEFLQQYEYMRDLGINVASNPTGLQSRENQLRMLEAADTVGIKQLLWDTDLNNVLLDKTISDEEAIMKARRIVSEYYEYDSFYGCCITDEPQLTEFEDLALAYKRFKEVCPDKMFYINMFPNYADTKSQLCTSSYEEYIEKYYEIIGLDYFCYDNYPLIRGKGGSTQVRDTFIYNMYQAKKAKEDTSVWTCLLSMGYGTMKDPDCTEDFRIQTNCALAMGLEGIVWFCYFSPCYGGAENFVPAIITLDGKKTEKYDLLKPVHQEIKNFENVYTAFTWKDIMVSIGSTNGKGENSAFNYFDPLEKHDRIVSFKSTYDAFMGVFKDSENRDGFMVVNYDDPSSKNINEIELEFRNATKVLVYINGTLTEVPFENSKIKLSLKASDAAFIIPLNI